MISPKTLSICCCLIATLVLSQSGSQNSLTAKETDPELAFQLQGEYIGNIRMGESFTMMGVQLIAKGKKGFAASMFQGGLPGRRWNGQQRWWFEGEENEAGLIMLTSKQTDWVLKQAAPRATRFQILKVAEGDAIGSVYRIRRASSTLGARPPAGAKVLFDGSLSGELDGAKLNDDSKTLKPGFKTREPVEDFLLHIEFKTPFEPNESGQGRGNSGVYIQRRYEVQILDSFGLDSKFNDCGSLYRQRPPAINMSFPPGQWQTYDIKFTPAKWDKSGEKKIQNAKITVRHNGVTIHDNVEITNKTGAGQKETPNALPILFQDHRNPVEYRNIWIVAKPKWKTASTFVGQQKKVNLLEFVEQPTPGDPVYGHVFGSPSTRPTSVQRQVIRVVPVPASIPPRHRIMRRIIRQ